MATSFDPQTTIQLLLGLQQQQSQKAQDTITGIQSQFRKGEELAAQSVEQQRAVVDQAALAAASKVEADYANAKVMEGLQSTFNMDQGKADNLIATNLAAARTAQSAYAPARAEYDQLAGADLLSNPIGYLFAQLKMPAAAAKVNALADAENIALQNIDTANRQLLASKSVITANTADTMREAGLAQAKADAALAQAKLTGQEAQNAVQIAANQMQVYQIEDRMLGEKKQTVNMVAGIQDRAEARAEARSDRANAAEERRQMNEIRQAQLEELLTKKQLEKEEEARLNTRLATVSQLLGYAEPVTVKAIKGMTNKKEQARWFQAATSGQLGSDLQSSLELYLGRRNPQGVAAGGGASINVTAERLARAGKSYEDQAHRMLTTSNLGKTPKPEEVTALAFELYRDAVTFSASSNKPTEPLSHSRWDSVYNPNQAQFLSFNTAIAQHPQLAALKTNVLKTTIDDLVKSGAVKTENLTAEQQQQVLAGAIEQVKNRAVLPKKAAADIAAYMRGAVTFNRALHRPELFAIPQQVSYPFTMQGQGSFSGANTVDLMNPADVENAIMWKVRQPSSPGELLLGIGAYKE